MRRLPDFLVRVATSRLRLLFGIGLPLGELTRGELPQRDGLPTQVPPGGCATAHARLRDQVRQYVTNPHHRGSRCLRYRGRGVRLLSILS